MFNKIKKFFGNLIKEKNNISLGKELEIRSQGVIIDDLETTILKIGSFQDGTIPGFRAERLRKSDFTRQRFQPGKYGGNLLSHDDVYYMCPKCKVIHPIRFKRGDVWKCSCGLIAQSHGNGLTIWE